MRRRVKRTKSNTDLLFIGFGGECDRCECGDQLDPRRPQEDIGFVQAYITYNQDWNNKRSTIYWYVSSLYCLFSLTLPPFTLLSLSSALPPLCFLFSFWTCMFSMQPCRSDKDSTTGDCNLLQRSSFFFFSSLFVSFLSSVFFSLLLFSLLLFRLSVSPRTS